MKAQTPLANHPKAEVWFDFDGTLADSAPGIMRSLHEAFQQNGMEIPSLVPTTVVGPPLADVIDSLAPSASLETRQRIVEAFRSSYDVRGYESTAPFVGFPEVLHALVGQGAQLRILTNKRQGPLERLVTRLGWADFFVGLHGIEEGRPHGPHTSKPDRAACLASSVGVAAVSIVGDGLDDLLAAERVGAAFFLAGWGYGTARVLAERPNVRVLQKPSDLLAQLSAAC